MATAKKTPSGMWKCRVYSHTTPDGHKHYKAFSAPTKAEAESMAARFSGSRTRTRRGDLTVSEAINGYITAKTAVLSPSTVRGYRDMEKNHFGMIGSRKIWKLTSADVQTFVSELSKELSPKSVKNIYGLLASSVALYAPEITFKIKLPTAKKKRSYAASDAQIMMLFNAASPMLKRCIALAAFTSLRRGEICALKYRDIHGTTIHVSADMVRNEDGEWIYKPFPKTAESDRFVPVPPEVISLLGEGDPDDFIIDRIPDTVTKRFCELRDRLGLDGIRFHDLRKYYASIAAALIPDLYAESFGGWRHGSGVLKDVYQQKIDPLEQKYADKMRSHFSNMILSNKSDA